MLIPQMKNEGHKMTSSHALSNLIVGQGYNRSASLVRQPNSNFNLRAIYDVVYSWKNMEITSFPLEDCVWLWKSYMCV